MLIINTDVWTDGFDGTYDADDWLDSAEGYGTTYLKDSDATGDSVTLTFPGAGTWYYLAYCGNYTGDAVKLKDETGNIKTDAGGNVIVPLTFDAATISETWTVGTEVDTNVPAATGGTAPYTYELDSGSMPDNLELGADGSITGVPTTVAGVAPTISVKVTDAAGATKTATITLPAIGQGTASLSGLTVNASGGTADYKDLFQIKNAAEQNITSKFSNFTYVFTSQSDCNAEDNGSNTGIKNVNANGTVTFTVTATDASGNYANLSGATVTATVTYASYTVNYDGNAPYSGAPQKGTPTADTTGTPSAAVNAAACTDAYDGYTFAGWNTQADGTGTDVAAGTAVPGSDALTDGQSTTLYAQWTANELTFADENFVETSGVTVLSAKAFSAFTAAGSGTGAYTYTIEPDEHNMAGASIDSATRVITVTPANTTDKTVKVRATDDNSRKTAVATFTYNGTIARAAGTISFTEKGQNVTQSDAKRIITPVTTPDDPVTADPTNAVGTPGAAYVAYWVPTPAVPAVHCDCGYGNSKAHAVDCAYVVDPSHTTPCNCAYSSDADSTTLHDAACAYKAANAGSKCNCGLGDADGANVTGGTHDWDGGGTTTETCAYTDAIPAGGSWKKFNDATAYLGALQVGDQVKVKVWLPNGSALVDNILETTANGDDRDATGIFTVIADPVVPSGGGGVSTYTVKYDAGEHGKLAEGAAASEKVKKGESPAEVPEIKAESGWMFLGWSLDGKTVVDPKTEKITKSVTYTALYGPAHSAYVEGVGNGLFSPEAGMTRAEAATMLARLTKGFEDKAFENPFFDVAEDAWYFNPITFGARSGLVEGWEDGGFHPEEKISRVEFIVMVARFMELEQVSGAPAFSDVAGDHWALGYINAMAQAGILKGYQDGTFKPDQAIRRDEAVKVINGALGRTPDMELVGANLKANPFSDVPVTQWAYYEIMEAAVEHAEDAFHTPKAD